MTRTTPEVKMAVSGPTDTAKDTAHASEFTTGDSLTILETLGPLLTKVYKADGSTEAYGDAAHYKIHQVPVANLDELSALLTELEPMSNRCQIHGRFVGKDKAMATKYKNAYARTNQNFSDQPLHTFIIDVDKYKPSFGDPVHEPDICIQEYIRKVLPPEFQNVSFHWQLSSSAGQPSNLDVLKCHVWFWLETPHKCSELYEWAKAIGPQVDKVVYRRVQVRYTASPIFEEGRTDPVPVRSGLFRGLRDDLPLVIGEAMLAQARDQGVGEGGNDMKLVDPSEKDGLIGLFHKTFSAEQVLLQLLDGDFEYASQRRWTWLTGGGGTKEGVWIHDDDMHVGSSHNTWPIDGIANLWDLVREFKFGHLDRSDDAFEQVDLDNLLIQAKPSHLAMIEYASGLDEIKAQQAEEVEQEARSRQTALENWRAQIRSAADEFTLREKLCPAIANDTIITASQREALAVEVNNKLGSLSAKPGVQAAKKLIKPNQAKLETDDKPAWLKGWCYVTDHDKFYRYNTEEWLTMQGFNAKYSRKVPPNAEGERLVATNFALDVFELETVVRGIYLPAAAPIFQTTGMKCVNTYRPSSVPTETSKLDFAGREAIKAVQAHLLYICNGREWLAEYLTDWLAHNVQYPGQKIRHSPVIQGIEGDGKSLLGTLLGQVMGEPNVRVIAPEVISKGDFNGWAEGACVGVLEELRLQGQNRFDILNSVKPCVTNDTISIHRKRLDPYNAPNTMNYIALTNHKDALPLDDTDRRWLVIFAPWDSIKQFEKIVGCSESEYFGNLHEKIYSQAPQLRRWLLDRDLATFNRNGRAPETEEKAIMVSLGVSDEASTARDLIAAGGLGYAQNIVSTRMLSPAMDAAGVEPPKSTAMNKMMLKLGFQKFPVSVKWNGETHRVWTKRPVTSEKEARCLLDATAAIQIGADFYD